MIKVNLYYDKKKNIVKILSRGHATKRSIFQIFPKNKEFNAICSALSTLEYTLLYSLETMTHIKKKIFINDGQFDLEIVQLKIKDKNVFEHLSGFFLIGLKALAKKI